MRKISIVLALMALILVLAACGGNDTPTGSGQTQTQDSGGNQADTGQQVETSPVTPPPIAPPADQAIDLSRYFTIIQGHRLEPGMSFDEVMSLGFRPFHDIEHYDHERVHTRVFVVVNYAGSVSDPELAVLNDMDITLTFTTPGTLGDVASVTEGYLSGVVIGGPVSEATLALRAADIGGEYELINLTAEAYAGVDFSHSIEDVIALWGEYSRLIESSLLNSMYYESDHAEIRVVQRNAYGVLNLISWEVRQPVLRSLGIEL